ncbi:MAG: DoxX family protein [Caldimonas sp.]
MATSSLRASAPRQGGIDAALLVLRLTLGILILLHGLSKLPPPPAFVAGMLVKMNLPSFIAYGVYLGEIVAPVLIIIGVWTRLAALVIVVNMLAALVLVHVPDLFHLGKSGGYALELQAMYLFSAVALMLSGAGRFSVGGRYGPMN